MFKKILIAEDIDSINLGVIEALKKVTDAEIHHVKYCDDALLKIKKGLLDNDPYDLLISDLSFAKDHRDVKLTSGEALIEAAKSMQPEIKTIVYSIEERSYVIKTLFKNLEIDGYVSKGREGSVELVKSLSFVEKDNHYISPHLAHLLADHSVLEIDDYDIELIKQLSQGISQEQIGQYFKNQGRSPSSTSAVEKRINKLKIYFKANNTIHLISITKDMGLV